MLKIEEAIGYTVSFVGTRSAVNAKTGDELLNVVAHYYQLPSHNTATCPVCKQIEARETKTGRRLP